MTAQASLAGMPGRERVDVLIYEAAKPVPPVPAAPAGARSASIKAWPLTRYQKRGEPCEVSNPLTGRTHRISLKQYEHLDPETTLVELIFHFVPVPYQSKEALGIRERTIRALRREYEIIISWHGRRGEARGRFGELEHTLSRATPDAGAILPRDARASLVAGGILPTDWPVGS